MFKLLAVFKSFPSNFLAQYGNSASMPNFYAQFSVVFILWERQEWLKITASTF